MLGDATGITSVTNSCISVEDLTINDQWRCIVRFGFEHAVYWRVFETSTVPIFIWVLSIFICSQMAPKHGRDTPCFQRKKARTHTAWVTRSWFLFRGIKLLNLPAYSSELNLIRNLRGLLIRRGYQHNLVRVITTMLNDAWEREQAPPCDQFVKVACTVGE